jgi:hypothetical protein
MGDEAGLGFQGLPHIGVETAFRDVAVNRHFLVLVALPQDAALALLDLGWLPGRIEMVQGHQSALNIRARPHFLGAAQEHAHLTTSHLVE